MRSDCIPSKDKFKTQNTKLRLLASDIISNCYTLGVLSFMVRVAVPSFLLILIKINIHLVLPSSEISFLLELKGQGHVM